MTPDPARKVLLIGWDGADWKAITPLLDAGLMPSLQSLVDRGVMGNIATLDPPLSPMLWTSIATGKTADKHGVLGFTQPSADGTRVQPVLGTSRTTKAVWNVFNQVGLRSNVVGWWPSHPAEPIDGAMVSNVYHRMAGPVDRRPPLPRGTVHPPDLADTLAMLRVHPQELTAAHLLPFVPGAAAVDTETDPHLARVAKTLAEAATIHAAGTYLMETRPWDFMAVYYDAIDHFGHGFMRHRPPHRPGIDPRQFELYHGVVDAAYRFHDMMLGRMLELAGDDATVMLLSDHGFHPDHLRPTTLPDGPAGPAAEHREFGVFVLAGPGIKRDERVYGVGLLDVAPTLLTLYGLPVGRDMDGAPVATAFQEPPEVTYVDSWDEIDGPDGMHAARDRSNPWAEQEAMRQLVDLGYVDAAQTADVDAAVRESQFYLARVYLSRGQAARAVPLLEAAVEADPEAERYGLALIDALRALGRPGEAEAVLERTADGRRRRLTRRLEETLAGLEGEPARDPAAREALRRREAALRHRLAAEPVGVAFQRALLRLDVGEIDRALAIVERIGAARRPALQLRLGEALLRARRWAEAEDAFRAVLAVDPERAPALRGLALAHLRRGRPVEAVEAALDALALQYHYPAAHVHLGEALIQLGDHARAAEALRVALAQNPRIQKAHLLLAELYRTRLDEPALATEHTRRAAEMAASAG